MSNFSCPIGPAGRAAPGPEICLNASPARDAISATEVFRLLARCYTRAINRKRPSIFFPKKADSRKIFKKMASRSERAISLFFNSFGFFKFKKIKKIKARAARANGKFWSFHKKTASLQTPYNKHSGSVFAFPFFVAVSSTFPFLTSPSLS